jgi:hypothetical protein
MNLDAVRDEIKSQVRKLSVVGKQPALVKLGRLQTDAWIDSYPRPNGGFIEWLEGTQLQQLDVAEVDDEDLVSVVARAL